MGKVETIDMFGPANVLAQARKDTMAQAREKGCSCPVCGQFVKIYHRTITSTMARQLIHAFHCYGTGQWFHVKNVVLGGSGVGDFPKLEHWGMIEHQHHDKGEEGKRTSGIWRITQKGEDFIHARATAPKYAVLYNALLLEHAGDQISIRDALGEAFDYAKLMAGTPADATPVHDLARQPKGENDARVM